MRQNIVTLRKLVYAGKMSSSALKITAVLGVLFALTGCEVTENNKIQAWITSRSGGRLMDSIPGLKCGIGGSPEEWAASIELDEKQVHQTIYGFGAAMTESSAWLISRLPNEKREKVMRALFDPVEGIGLSVLRQAIGSSDFALSHYSYCDVPKGAPQPKLDECFSIERERATSLPLLKEALRLQPQLKLMATPWSPPGWMKTSDSLIGGSLRRDRYNEFSEYLVRFIRAYHDEGISISRLTLQNEPYYTAPDYPGMRMEPEEQAEIIGKHLGPALQREFPETKILAWDHNWDIPQYPKFVLSNSLAAPFVVGAAFHPYAGNASSMGTFHREFPEAEVHMTESTSGAWAPHFSTNLGWDARHLLIASLKNHASTVLKFNLALDENYGPRSGGCPNCKGLLEIDSRTGEFRFNYDYYAMGHFSRFVLPGARRVETVASGKNVPDHVAFVNADGSRVLVAYNPAQETAHLRLVSKKGEFCRLPVPQGALVTVRW